MSSGLIIEDHSIPPTDFDEFLPWACKQLELYQIPVITREQQEVIGPAPAKAKPSKKTTSKSQTDVATQKTDWETTEESSESYPSVMQDGIAVNISTYYDNYDELVQVRFTKNRKLPRELMKVLSLALPFHKNLTSIALDSGVTDGIIYEIANLLPVSVITEVCLDGAFVEQANFGVLLDRPQIKHLSLSRCRITDKVVKSIVAKISFPYGPSANCLSALNLASNKITDLGMQYLGEILRANRKLSYLNVSDNRITDKGATYIFDSLKLFPLTHDEAVEMKSRYMHYLKYRAELVEQMIETLKEEEETQKNKPSSAAKQGIAKRKSEFKPLKGAIPGDYLGKAEAAVHNMLGPYDDPFSKENINVICHQFNCLGNNVLCYINFAYNHLTYLSVSKLKDLLLEQSRWLRKPRGLVNVRLEGNNVPEFCKDYVEIDDMLTSGVVRDSNVGGASRTKSMSHRSKIANNF